MKVIVQRVVRGSVAVEGKTIASIGTGLVILVGVKVGDEAVSAEYLAEKCANLRVFEDAGGKMNLGIREVGGSALVVSQFTLYADTQRGNRPGFSGAARPEVAEPLYQLFVRRLRSILGEDSVQTGLFGGMMEVTIVNDGPVTLTIEHPHNEANRRDQ